MRVQARSALAAVAVTMIAIGSQGTTLADEARRHVVAASDIQAGIDRRLDRADADRQAIQTLLQRADVREIAGSYGLDLEVAGAAAAVLEGPSLQRLAARPQYEGRRRRGNHHVQPPAGAQSRHRTHDREAERPTKPRGAARKADAAPSAPFRPLEAR